MENFDISDVFYKNTMDLDPKIWWSHYQFVLQSIVMNYPHTPNETSQKRMYEIIMSLPLWVPHEHLSKIIIELLNEYPVSSYLTNRTTFLKWMYEFVKRMRRLVNDIERKRNPEEPVLFEELSYYEFIQYYYYEYLPDSMKDKEYKQWLLKMKTVGMMSGLIILIGYFSWKEYKK